MIKLENSTIEDPEIITILQHSHDELRIENINGIELDWDKSSVKKISLGWVKDPNILRGSTRLESIKIDCCYINNIDLLINNKKIKNFID